MYRAITLRVLEEGIPVTAPDRIQELVAKIRIRLERSGSATRVLVDDRDVTGAIRSPEVTMNVSLISSYAPVRQVMVREQRRIAQEGGVVLEGRDIGTVVLPDADLKVYLVANVAERVRRRKREFELSGVSIDQHELVKDIVERDRKDSTRETSPLRKAPDAIELDTSTLTIEEQVEFVVQKARAIIRELESK